MIFATYQNIEQYLNGGVQADERGDDVRPASNDVDEELEYAIMDESDRIDLGLLDQGQCCHVTCFCMLTRRRVYQCYQ